jgi:hypothetical protein
LGLEISMGSSEVSSIIPPFPKSDSQSFMISRPWLKVEAKMERESWRNGKSGTCTVFHYMYVLCSVYIGIIRCRVAWDWRVWRMEMQIQYDIIVVSCTV